MTDRSNWPTKKMTRAEARDQFEDLSGTTTGEERWAVMWQLALDAWAFKGEPVLEQRLPRHIVRIARRERPAT
jgi:hypothetical protein